MAAAEGWDGGTGGACNGFLYRFHGVRIAHAPGGGLGAAEGWLARQRLASLRP